MNVLITKSKWKNVTNIRFVYTMYTFTQICVLCIHLLYVFNAHNIRSKTIVCVCALMRHATTNKIKKMDFYAIIMSDDDDRLGWWLVCSAWNTYEFNYCIVTCQRFSLSFFK